MTKAIFIDRDGVLLREILLDPTIGPASEVINSWDKFEILPGVDRAFMKLKDKDYRLLVITNQDGIDEGWLPLDFYNATNARLVDFIREQGGAFIDNIYTCPHSANGTCDCRKPKRGLIDQALRDYPEIDPSRSWFIGDRSTDVKLGKAIGAKTIFIRIWRFGIINPAVNQIFQIAAENITVDIAGNPFEVDFHVVHNKSP